MLELKVAEIFAKRIHISFYFKIDVYQNSKKVTKYLGNFCSNICHQEITKITQSGHTGSDAQTNKNMGTWTETRNKHSDIGRGSSGLGVTMSALFRRS